MYKVYPDKILRFRFSKLCSVFILSFVFQIVFWSFIVFADSPSDLDSTFNGTGIVITSIASADNGNAVAIQPDGKIVVAGVSYDDFSTSDFVVVRYKADGTPDTTFGGGAVKTPVSAGSDHGIAVALQPDGKIVVGGASQDKFAIVRYTINGDLDNTFNGTGIVTTSISNYRDAILDIAIQPGDNKIVVTGRSQSATTSAIALARYTITGSLDTTFNGTGIFTTTCEIWCNGHSLVLQNNGKIVVAGISGNGSVFDGDFVVMRINSDGSLDNTFGQTGIITTPVETGFFGHPVDAALQSDGKIVVVGSSGIEPSGNSFGTVRYNSDGSLDTTFNGTGIVTTVLSGDDDANAVAIQPNGKIIVAGTREYGINSDLALVRYNSNGSLDTSFNGTGILVTSINNHSYGTSMALQSDGKIVVTGGTGNSSDYSTDDIFVVRYIGDRPTLFLPVIMKQ